MGARWMRLAGRGILLGLLGVLLAAGAVAEPGEWREVRLEYVPDGLAWVIAAPKGCVFPAEGYDPGEKGDGTIRGRLPVGPEEAEWMPFVLDMGAGTFSVDLEGTGDFTVFSSDVNIEAQTRIQSRTVCVKGIRIDIPRGEASVRYLFDLSLVEDRGGLRPGLHPNMVTIDGSLLRGLLIMMRSGWAGTMEHEGRRWPLLLMDNLDGALDEGDLLAFHEKTSERPFEEPPFEKRQEMIRTLCLDGKVFDFSYGFEGGGEKCELVIGLAEADRPMGEIVLEGEDISRVTLVGAEHLCLIPPVEPTAPMKIPVGRYAIKEVLLEGEEDGVAYWANAVEPKTKVAVEEGAAAPVRLGGPLTASVAGQTRGNYVHLYETFTGVDGDLYHIQSEGFRGPFRITIEKWGIPFSSLFYPRMEYG